MADKGKLGEIMDSELIDNRWAGGIELRPMKASQPHCFISDIGNGEHFALLSFSNAYQAGASRQGLALLD